MDSREKKQGSKGYQHAVREEMAEMPAPMKGRGKASICPRQKQDNRLPIMPLVVGGEFICVLYGSGYLKESRIQSLFASQCVVRAPGGPSCSGMQGVPKHNSSRLGPLPGAVCT